jgi:hypothetical protein
MTAPVRSLRLTQYHSVDLDKNSFTIGEIFFDVDTFTLRIYNGQNTGGIQLLRNDLTNLKTGALNHSLLLGTGNLTAQTITAQTGFLGNLTGNITGNVTGNITGNVTGNITGNAGTSTKLASSVNINGVAFDGSQSITITAAATTVAASGITGNTLPTTILTSSLTTVGTLGSLTVTGAINANGGVVGGLKGSVKSTNTNNVILDTSAATAKFTGTVTGNVITTSITSPSGSSSDITINPDGSGNTKFAPGTEVLFQSVTPSTSYATGSIVISGGVGVAGDVNSNGDISVAGKVTLPNLPVDNTDATNKKYVDAKAVALAIGLS